MKKKGARKAPKEVPSSQELSSEELDRVSAGRMMNEPAGEGSASDGGGGSSGGPVGTAVGNASNSIVGSVGAALDKVAISIGSVFKKL